MIWREHDVVLAEPLRAGEAVGLLGHGNHLPLGAGDPRNHHARGGGVLLRRKGGAHLPGGWISMPRKGRVAQS